MKARHGRTTVFLRWAMGALLGSALLAQATTVFKVNFDAGAQNPAPNPYVAQGSDIFPGAMWNTCNSSLTQLGALLNVGKQGGQQLVQTNGAAAPVRQGYMFGGLAPSYKWLSNTFTIEAIIRPQYSDAVYNGTNYGKTSKSVIFYGDPPGYGELTTLFLDQTTHKVGYTGNGGYGQMTSASTLEEGRWYHVAVVIKGSGDGAQATYLYINNVLDATGGYPLGWETLGIFYIASNITIGASADIVSNNFCGAIDAVAVSDTALGPNAWALPLGQAPGNGVVLRANFDIAAQNPAPTVYLPGGPSDVLPAGCGPVLLGTNNTAIVADNGKQGTNAFSMTLGAAAPVVQGYCFYDVSTNVLVQNTFTVEAIIKPNYADAIYNGTNYGKTAQSVILYGQRKGYSQNSILYVDQTTRKLKWYGASGYGDMTSVETLEEGRWHHVAVVVNGGNDTVTMYINGVPDTSGIYPGGWELYGIFNIGRDVIIGGDRNMLFNSFCGSIDAVAISDTARDPTSFVLPYGCPLGTGVVFKATFDLSAQSPAPRSYTLGLANDIIPQGCASVLYRTNATAIVPATGLPGTGRCLAMSEGAAAPDVQGYVFWDVATNMVVRDNFTIEAVVQPSYVDAVVNGTNYGKTNESFILAGWTPDRCTLRVDQTTGKVHFRGYTPYGLTESDKGIPDGYWTHIAVVVDGAALEVRMYINGVLQAVKGDYPDGWQTQGIYNLARHLFVGTKDGTTAASNFRGLIDGIAISDSVRTPATFVLPIPPGYGTVFSMR